MHLLRTAQRADQEEAHGEDAEQAEQQADMRTVRRNRGEHDDEEQRNDRSDEGGAGEPRFRRGGFRLVRFARPPSLVEQQSPDAERGKGEEDPGGQ